VPAVKATGCPVPLRVRYRRRPVSELPRILHPPAPIDGYPSYLGSLTIRSPWLNLRVAPDIQLWLTSIDQFPGCPKSWVSRRSPIPFVSSCPELQFLG
jgi:hypothetical protein